MAAWRAVGLVAALALATPAAAQGGGRAWSIGLGGGWMDMGCAGCDALPDSVPYGPGGALGGSVGLGWRTTPRLQLGGTLLVMARRQGPRDATLLAPLATAEWRPRADGPIRLRGGVGLSIAILAGGGTLVESSGVAAMAEAGWRATRPGALELEPHLGAVAARNSASSASVRVGEGQAVGPPRSPRAVYLGLRVARSRARNH